MSRVDAKWAEALGGQRFDGSVATVDEPQTRQEPVGTSPVVVPLHRPENDRDDAIIGKTETGIDIGLKLAKLVEGRLLIQGNSGAGKSWTLRRLLEQTAGQVQQIVVDPEGEFGSLAKRFDLVHVAAHQLDTAAIALLAGRAREHRLSLVLDLSEADRDQQMKTIAAFFFALIDAPRETWSPALVVVDEAHLFAPFGGATTMANDVRKQAIAAMTDLMSRGRKRGLCGILATQRLARLHKSVVAEAQNFLIGLNTLDLDIRRAAETIGWDARKAFDRLPELRPGDFAVVGPAFSVSPVIASIGPVETEHRGAAPAFVRPARIDAEAAAGLLDIDSLIEASAADEQIREANAVSPGFRAVRAFIRDPSFADAGRVFAALAALAPEGALLDELGPFLELDQETTAAALALLDQFGAVEFSGDESGQAVRVAKGMTP